MLWTLGLARRHANIAFAFICVMLLGFIFHQRRRDQQLVFNPADGTLGSTSTSEETNNDVSICRKHNFKPYVSADARERKIYDLFLFSHELDWLEIRLNTLSPNVDYFVIVEAPTTFTGMVKPLYLKDNWSNFTMFHDKIIHSVVIDPGPSIGLDTWTHEDFFRNALFTSTFPSLLSTEKEAREGDVLLVSDVDEIPKPHTLEVLRECEIPDRLTLRSNFYYYSFQWLHTGEQWPHPQATVYHGLTNTLTPNHLRNGIGGSTSRSWPASMIQRWRQKADMWDAAWHCSSCFSTLDQMRAKMDSFSHTPWNTPENRDEATMMQRVRTGQDLFGRKSERYRRVNSNNDAPQYVLEHKDRFEYLVNRDGENAGFSDWSKPPAL